MPAIEKGLLRSPEVILTSVLKPLIQSLPHHLDLSGTLEDNLLKPILSNVKSSNAVIREGSVEAFHAIIIRCKEEKALDRIVQEIAGPLKSGKLASPDHRALHARMLEGISLTVSSAEICAISLATAASKEGNEGSLVIEARAMAKAFTTMLNMDKPLPSAALESLVKGLSDKKPAIRKAWLLTAGRILRSVLSAESTPASVLFVEAVMPKLLTAFEEAASNAAAAAQSGLIVAAYILPALAPGISNCYAESIAAPLLSKAHVLQRALNVTDKQPFLLNYRIYNKLSAEEDLRWLGHSLSTVSREMTKETDEAISIAWSEAVIYLITVPSLPSQIQREMIQRLSELYAENPEFVSNVIIAGLWHCLEQTDSKDIEAKVENTNLVRVIRCICLNAEELRELNGSPSEEVLEAQASSLLVLARPELIPKANWIDSVLHMGIDPGELALKNRDNMLKEIGRKTSLDQV